MARNRTKAVMKMLTIQAVNYLARSLNYTPKPIERFKGAKSAADLRG
jgi:hypothetical protein